MGTAMYFLLACLGGIIRLQQIEGCSHQVSVRLQNGSEHLNLLMDVNSKQTWIFAEKANRVFTYKDLKAFDQFNVSYDVEGRESSAAFEGYLFDEQLTIEADPTKLQFSGKIGYVFRSTLDDTTPFADGILGLEFLANHRHTSKSIQQITVKTDEDGTKSQLLFGESVSEHCTSFSYSEPIINEHDDNWKIYLKNITFGNQLLSHHFYSKKNRRHLHKTDQPIALLSTLTPAIFGPKRSVKLIYEHFDVQMDDKSTFPIIDCDQSLNAPDLIFKTEHATLRLSPKKYIQKKDETCYLHILPSLKPANYHHWTLGQPFFFGRCVTFDYAEKEIKFSDIF